MTAADISREHVERLAAFHSTSAELYYAPDESGLRACAVTTAATLRALRAALDTAESQATWWQGIAGVEADRGNEVAAELATAQAELAKAREALREIVAADPVDLALDPEWSQRIARAALPQQEPSPNE